MLCSLLVTPLRVLLPPCTAYSHLLFLPESFHPASAAPNLEEASQILLNPLPLCNSSAFASWNSHSVEFIFIWVFPTKLESAGKQSAMTFCPDYIPHRCFIFKTEQKGKLLGEEEAQMYGNRMSWRMLGRHLMGSQQSSWKGSQLLDLRMI